MRTNCIKRLVYLANGFYKGENRVKNISLLGLQGISTKEIMSGDNSKNHGMPLKIILKKLNEFADLSLAEKWDNVGLLIEPPTEKVIDKILLTNDLTEVVMEEAVKKGTNLIISYHPPIFTPLKKITKASWKERIVASCIENGIAVFSPHTSWDAVFGGVTDWLADAFAPYIIPSGKRPLVPSEKDDNIMCIASIIGAPMALDKIVNHDNTVKFTERQKLNGREMCSAMGTKKAFNTLRSLDHEVSFGILECGKNASMQNGMGRLLEVRDLTVSDCVRLIKMHTGVSHIRLACAQNQTEASSIKTIALVPGSGGSILKGIEADLFVTGEMFHHDILDANHHGTSVILTNHSECERGFLSKMVLLLKDVLQNSVKIEVSSCDSDPLKTI